MAIATIPMIKIHVAVDADGVVVDIAVVAVATDVIVSIDVEVATGVAVVVGIAIAVDVDSSKGVEDDTKSTRCRQTTFIPPSLSMYMSDVLMPETTNSCSSSTMGISS